MVPNHFYKIGSALTIACLTILCGQTAVAAETVEAIKLIQTHFFMGKNIVVISQNALRFENISQLKYILVAKAPDWNVTVFRTDDKTYFTEKFKDFTDTGLMSDLLIGRHPRYPITKDYRHSIMHMGGVQVERLTASENTIKYIELKTVTAPQVELLLHAIYKCTTNGGIPVAFVSRHHGADFVTGMKQDGKIDTGLDTEKIEKIKVSSTLFTMPTGYKKAKSIREVVSGSANRAGSEDASSLFREVK